MSLDHFLVIGSGSAGYAAARTARETLDRVAIVNNSPQLGGLCILRGCMPSKTLIYSAEILHHAQQGQLFGLNIPEARVGLFGDFNARILGAEVSKAALRRTCVPIIGQPLLPAARPPISLEGHQSQP